MEEDNKKKLVSFFSLVGAIMLGDVNKTNKILDEGENINGRFTDLEYKGEKAGNTMIAETDTPLLVAVKSSAQPNIIKLLLERGANVNVKDQQGKTPLEIADQRNLADIVKILKNAEVR